METDEGKKAVAYVTKAVKDARPEIQAWVDDHWKDSWSEDTGDRWDLSNLQTGWNLDEVK